MAKKADLQKEAESLGVDPTGLKVAELEAAIGEAQATQTAEAPAATAAPSPSGRHAAHAYGTPQGVHVQLGHMAENGDGVMEFRLASEWVLGWDEALALAEELPGAAADHNSVSSHSG